jgi:predicted anti-sigma-YlaC factor YlaD
MYAMGLAPACEQTRDHLSAALDGAATADRDADDAEYAERHLAECEACSAWWERVRALSRLTRTAAWVPTPGLGEAAMTAILAAAPRRPSRLANVLRIALFCVGLAQFLLGVSQIGDLGASEHGHLWHESASWNVAVGAALAWLAWRRTRPGGLLPVMTAFVGVLTLLTINDALIATVEFSRILSHGFVLVGYALLLLLNRQGFGEPPASSDQRPKPWRVGPTSSEPAEGPLATVHPLPVRLAYRKPVTVQQRHTARRAA